MRILKRLPIALSVLALGAFIGAGVVTVDNATSTPETSATASATAAQEAAGTATPAMAEREPYEDEPGFDCRIHGNKECGVFYEGIWQVISYDAAGNPISLRPRGF